MPFADVARGLVYKLYDLRGDGSLGKKLVFRRDPEGGWEPGLAEATIYETIEKLAVLHEAGGLPTEVLGLDDSGTFLLAKQPLAFPFGDDLMKSRVEAALAMKAVLVSAPRMHEFRVFWCGEKAWGLGDLHRGNIMRDAGGAAVVIDALLAEIPAQVVRDCPGLARALATARRRADGLTDDEPDLLTGGDDSEL